MVDHNFRNPRVFEVNYEFECFGPSVPQRGSGTRWDPKLLFQKMTIARCLEFSDCRCENYLEAVTEMERLDAIESEDIRTMFDFKKVDDE